MATISRLEKEKRRAESKNNTKEVASLCNLLGVELLAIGDHEGALEQHRHEAGLCASIGDEVGVAVAHRRMGEVYGEMGDYSRAVYHQTKHLTLARKAGSIVEEQRALATLGRTHLQRAEEAEVEGRVDEASEALKEAERAFLKSLVTCEQLVGVVEAREHGQMLARLYLNLGLVLDQRGNSTKGSEFIQQALDLCIKYGFNEDGYRCHYALASVRYKTSKLVVALQHVTKALQLAKKLHQKSFETDCLNFMGQIHVANEDLQAAKKSFYKLYKLQKVSLEERAKATKKLKTIVSMCLAEDALVILGEFRKNEKMKNYEKLGDGFSFFDCYNQALRYYHLMFDMAVKLEKLPSDLAPIYVSLARTYQDVKKYAESKEFYEKELEVHLVGDPKEACKTLMNLALVQELMGHSYMDLAIQYERARALAQKASNVKLEVEVLRLHKALTGIPSSDLQELEDAIESLTEANGLDPEGGISEDEAYEDSEDEVDLNDIVFSDSDEESLNQRRGRRGGQNKSGIWKRNQKGETALHTACIDGNMVMVKKLIQQGHPINPRDNCGWLPLHEACNYGYVEIAELLLDAGAHVNDRGGAQCNGITPLHDAASCGNLVVMKLLISRGASLISKNDSGEVPLTCLVNFRQRASLTLQEERECIEFEEQMKAAMIRAGHNVPAQPSPMVPIDGSRRTGKARGRTVDVSPQLRRCQSISDRENDTDDELPDIMAELRPSGKTKLPSRVVVSDDGNSDSEDETLRFRNPLLEDVQQTSSACKTYASAISSVGSASRQLQKSSSISPKESISALLSRDDDVGDDWLVDDLGPMSRKRKRQDRFDFEYRETRKDHKSSPTDGLTTTSKKERKSNPTAGLATASTSHSISTSLSSSSSRHMVKESKKLRQIKLTSILQRSSDAEGESSSSRSRPPISNTSSSTSVIETLESKSPSGNENWDQTLRNVNKAPGPMSVVNGVPRTAALRVRVHVRKHILLVPVAADCMGRTVEWLAKEAATRYYQLSGLRPTLSLNTKDGAVLHPEDALSLALSGSHDEELHAEVQGWDLQPLAQRYTDACKALGSVHVRFIAASLQEAESSGNLEVMGRASRIGLSTLQPMLRALQWQQALQSIVIPHVRLGDEGAKLLLEALPTLPFLRVLDLSNCRITVNTLTALMQAIRDGDVQLKNLASLELSHNLLTGITASTLEALWTLPSLASLSLKHCGLHLKEDLDVTKMSSALRNLALDHNCVEEVALTRLLACTPRLANLTLSGSCPESQLSESSSNGGKVRLMSWGMGTALAKVLGEGSECCLEHLDVSSCCLSDSDVVELTTYLYRCTSLTWLSLAHNPGVSATSLASLVSEVSASTSVPPLTTLLLHGCAPVSASAHSLLDALLRLIQRRAHLSFKTLSRLSVCTNITSEAATMLSEAWNDAHTVHAQTTTVGNEVFLHRDDNEFPGGPL